LLLSVSTRSLNLTSGNGLKGMLVTLMLVAGDGALVG
jgi:hypothetical protein